MTPITNPMAYVSNYAGDLVSAIAISILLEMTPILVLAVFIARLGQERTGSPSAARAEADITIIEDMPMRVTRRGPRRAARIPPTASKNSTNVRRVAPKAATGKWRIK